MNTKTDLPSSIGYELPIRTPQLIATPNGYEGYTASVDEVYVCDNIQYSIGLRQYHMFLNTYISFRFLISLPSLRKDGSRGSTPGARASMEAQGPA